MQGQLLADTTVNYLSKTTHSARYSMKEVGSHCDVTSCWIVISDRVYDVTNFVNSHPGGCDIILEHAGRDATVTFKEKGHSGFAFELLEQYHIGHLEESECMEIRR